MLQLNPSLPVYVVGRGTGECLGWFDYGKEDHLLWLVAMDDTGECWLVPNPQVRMCYNPSLGRMARQPAVTNQEEKS